MHRKTPPTSQDEMDVDTEGPAASEEGREDQEDDEPDSEPVPLTRVVLVGEAGLEGAYYALRHPPRFD